MRAPHLTGNVLVRGDRPSLPVGTDGKDGSADAEDADVRDGRVALPRGGGCPPAAVWRPDLYVCEGVMGSMKVRSQVMKVHAKKRNPPQRDGVTKNAPVLLNARSLSRGSKIICTPLGVCIRLLL